MTFITHIREMWISSYIHVTTHAVEFQQKFEAQRSQTPCLVQDSQLVGQSVE